MTLAARNLVIQDEKGDLKAGASIEVRLDVQGQPLAAIFQDRAGLVPLANPFVTGDGRATFYAIGGAYQIKATLGAFEDLQRYVAIGRGAESDLTVVTPRGTWSNAVSYNAGDLVTHTGTAGKQGFVSLQNGNLNHAPDADTPIADTAWWMHSPGTTSEQAQAILDAATAQAGVATAQAGLATAEKVAAAASALNAAASAASAASSSVSPALRYFFDTGTSAVGLLTQEFRVNNATLSAVTEIYVHDNAVQGAVAAYLNTIFNGSSPTKGHILLVNPQDESKFAIFKCTSAVDETGYTRFVGTVDASAGPWVDAWSFVLQFTKTGDQGAGDMTAANNLSDVANAATAFGNIKQGATTAASGVARLGTLAEANAGVLSDVIVAPTHLANRLRNDLEDQNITGGASATSKALGTAGVVSSGIVTLDLSDRQGQHYTNSGAHTLAPDAAGAAVFSAAYLKITNGAAPGVITLTGWHAVRGDVFTLTPNAIFECVALSHNGTYVLWITAI